MRRILKYPLVITDRQAIEMPANSLFLSAQMQREQLMLWAIVDSSQPCRQATIDIYGTGHPVPEAGDMLLPNGGYSIYIDTVQHLGMVWHVFGACPTVFPRTVAQRAQ